ncbi:MAG TPA: tetratricopeptide repeat protein [Pseudomonadales bacterium]|nr:tetratricopeptide repeat protein [Pseudomonadales bacterium]
MRFLTVIFFTLFIVGSLQAQEQYRSRMYIDLDVAPTENVSLSVGELEQKIGTFHDDATRASAEKFLAQHYAGQKDYNKAAEHIEGALKNPATSSESKRDMLGELSRIYLLQKNYDKAATTIGNYLAAKQATGSAADADIYLLLAQVQYKRKNYVASADALDKALALQKNPSKELLQSALAVYYSIGNFDRAGQVMQQLLAADINNAELWQQWVSLYLKGGKHAQALDVMALAWEKGIPFREQDILLLTDLYSINKIPGRGARVLEEAIASGRIKSNTKINDRLFRLWMQAGERDKAQQALAQAASGSNDVELQLYLAQMQMEKEQWQPMQSIILKACDDGLPERLVARANLLLGVSQLKLGDTELARRSFINATIVGGAGEEASKWLAFMKAAPATDSEKVGIAGPCSTSDTRSIFSASMPDSKQPVASTRDQSVTDEPAATPEAGEPETKTTESAPVAPEPAPATPSTLPTRAGAVDMTALANIKGDPAAVLEIKTTESQKLFLAEYSLTPEELSTDVAPLATRLGISVAKGGGKIDGPMHIIFPEPPNANGGKIKVRFGFPVTGNPRPDGRYQLIRDNGFKCVSRQYNGAPEGVITAIAQLYADATAKGLKLTGESRQLASTDNVIGGKTVKLELQLGVQ